MSYGDILELPKIKDGGSVTDQEVAAELGLKIRDARARLSALVIREKLTRIPGVASRPAAYKLKTARKPWGAPTNVL